MSETPESNPGALVVSSPKALAIANRQSRIAGQALARIEQERYIEFFATHPHASRAFVEAISQYFPCSEAMIERYADRWNWNQLSSNEALPWSEVLVERYADRWGWAWLSSNKTLPWSDALIERYADGWYWPEISINKALPWSADLVAHHSDSWDWCALCCNSAVPWTEEMLLCHSHRWGWPAWAYLSRHGRLPWTVELIEKYSAYWHFEDLATNENLPWTNALIEKYEDRWFRKVTGYYEIGLAPNRVLPWSEALIERYCDKWGWSWLSRNPALPWSDDLIVRYEDRWCWTMLSQNAGLPWNEALLGRYADRWDWVFLSSNRALPWSDALIERYASVWHWASLSSNTALPWSTALIECYSDRWDWGGLFGNEALPWTEVLVERYADCWDWVIVPQTALSKILLRWSESSVCAVLDRMPHGLESGDDSIRAYCSADAVDPAETGLHHENPAQPPGIDSELLVSGMTLAGYYMEGGVHRVADVAACLAADLEIPVSQFQNYLRCCYNSARDVLEDTGHDVSEMDDPDAVKREFERLFPEAMHGTACARVSVSVQDKRCASDAVDHTKDKQHHENPAQPTALDPKLLEIGAEMAVFYVERGVRTFADVAQRLAADSDGPLERLRPYLRAWYNGARDMMEDAGHDVSDMDNPAAVKRELERLWVKPDQSDTIAPRPGPAQTEVTTPLCVPRSKWNQESPDLAEPAATDGLDQSLSARLTTLLDKTPGGINPIAAFDEAIYAQATPLFRLGMSYFQTAGADITEMAKALVRTLVRDHGLQREAIKNMRPYLKRFVEDVESGAVTLGAESDQRGESQAEALHKDNLHPETEDARALMNELKGTGAGPVFNAETYAR